jgi:glutamate carboxypeptidase
MLFTTDEEMGSTHSREIIEQMARESALVMIAEPALPNGSLKTARKSTGLFHLHTYGVSAHAGGAHEEGVNAIVEMAHQITRIQESRWHTRSLVFRIGPITSVAPPPALT